jgi:hypothetical protein
MAVSTEDAIRLGTLLLDSGYIAHTTRDHTFKDEHLFYVFVQDEEGKHGGVGARRPDGSKASWSDFLPLFGSELGEGRVPSLPRFEGGSSYPVKGEGRKCVRDCLPA